jgi:alpha-beta hydrolase superfamily lysophospholipase
MISKDYQFHSFDGLLLEGTLLSNDSSPKELAVLVHGGGVDRNECGIYTRLAEKLINKRMSSFRFDYRAHGRSEGKLEEMTLLGIVNDIHSAVTFITKLTDLKKVHLVGSSLGGGLSAFYTARNPDQVKSLVLMNPLLNYKSRLLDEKPFWFNNQLTEEGRKTLNADGWLRHYDVLRLGRPLINELFFVQPHLEMSKVQVPTLTIHGTRDSKIPYDVTQQYYRVNSECRLLTIDGADHEFAKPGDDEFKDPQTVAWQDYAIDNAAEWIMNHCLDRRI